MKFNWIGRDTNLYIWTNIFFYHAPIESELGNWKPTLIDELALYYEAIGRIEKRRIYVLGS